MPSVHDQSAKTVGKVTEYASDIIKYSPYDSLTRYQFYYIFEVFCMSLQDTFSMDSCSMDLFVKFPERIERSLLFSPLVIHLCAVPTTINPLWMLPRMASACPPLPQTQGPLSCHLMPLAPSPPPLLRISTSPMALARPVCFIITMLPPALSSLCRLMRLVQLRTSETKPWCHDDYSSNAVCLSLKVRSVR